MAAAAAAARTDCWNRELLSLNVLVSVLKLWRDDVAPFSDQIGILFSIESYFNLAFFKTMEIVLCLVVVVMMMMFRACHALTP